MKKLKIKHLLFGVIILFGTQNLFGQVLTTAEPPIYQPNRRDVRDGIRREELLPASSRGAELEMSSYSIKKRKQSAEEIEESRMALSDIQEAYRKFSAPPQYLAKYPHYATSSKSGIFRLYPEKGCNDSGKVINAVELRRCANLPQIRGFGAKMSFRLLAFLPDKIMRQPFSLAASDIYFTENTLKVGNDSTEAVASEIGDIDLEKIDSNSEAVKFLKKWKKSKNTAGFISNKQLLDKGLKEGNYMYSSNVPVKLNSAYALRSIAYYQRYQGYWATDLLVAFKIVGQEKDGSIVIIWKQLQKKDAPALRK